MDQIEDPEIKQENQEDSSIKEEENFKTTIRYRIY